MSRLCLPWLLSLLGVSVPSSNGQEKPPAFVEKTVVLRYESGLVVKARYPSAKELVWEALAGPEKGRKGTEVMEAVQVAPEIFFISWLEEEGTSVSNVLDFGAKRVYAFVTFESESDGRRSLFDRGTVEILPD
jgi:hypothetical protein